MTLKAGALFISIEGGEGAGKSLLIKALASFFSQKQRPCLISREPGGTTLGEALRSLIIEHNNTPLAELLMILAARAQHLEEKILPALAQNIHVLCDRFCDSTVAYQGGGRELGIEYVQALCSHILPKGVPDLTLLIDVPIEVGFERVEKRKGPKDQIEKEKHAFHERVRTTFLSLAKKEPKRIHIIDGRSPPEEVASKGREIIEHFMAMQ